MSTIERIRSLEGVLFRLGFNWPSAHASDTIRLGEALTQEDLVRILRVKQLILAKVTGGAAIKAIE